jgi:hypothetical protein
MPNSIDVLKFLPLYLSENIYVTGEFTSQRRSSNSSPSLNLNHIAQYSSKDNAWLPLGSGVDSKNMKISVDIASELLYVSGPLNSTTDVLSVIRRQNMGIPAWNLTSGAWVSDGVMAVGNVTYIQTLQTSSQSDALLITGQMTNFNTLSTPSIALIDSSGLNGIGGVSLALNTTLNVASASYDGNGTDVLYVGGSFTLPTTPVSRNVGMYSSITQTWRYPGFHVVDGSIGSIAAVAGSKMLWIGGSFSTVSIRNGTVDANGLFVVNLNDNTMVQLPGLGT